MHQGRRWSVRDSYESEIYLTDERWEHILEGHPEMAAHEDDLRETIRSGKRRQDPLNPQKYRYLQRFSDLFDDNTHVEVIVLFRFEGSADGGLTANNYVVTAYQKQIG